MWWEKGVQCPKNMGAYQKDKPEKKAQWLNLRAITTK